MFAPLGRIKGAAIEEEGLKEEGLEEDAVNHATYGGAYCETYGSLDVGRHGCLLVGLFRLDWKACGKLPIEPLVLHDVSACGSADFFNQGCCRFLGEVTCVGDGQRSGAIDACVTVDVDGVAGLVCEGFADVAEEGGEVCIQDGKGLFVE